MRIALGIFAIAVSACVPKLGPPIVLGPESLQDGATTAFVAGALADQGYIINMADEASGIVNTEWQYGRIEWGKDNASYRAIREIVQVSTRPGGLLVQHVTECMTWDEALRFDYSPCREVKSKAPMTKGQTPIEDAIRKRRDALLSSLREAVAASPKRNAPATVMDGN